MFPLLTLDESTLFYWTLSDISHKNQKHLSAIGNWASAIPRNGTTSQGPKSTSIHTRSDIPSLTCDTTTGRSYAPSILSDNVKIISHQFSDVAKVKAEPAPALSSYNDGGLSDNDEIRGEELDFAINSPPKGKRRINSEVFIFS